MAGLYFLFMKHFFSLMRGWPVALLILLWLAGPAARAQAPAWQTAVGVPTSIGAESVISYTVADGNGNAYLVGYFNGTVAFGSTTLTSSAPLSPGNYDLFIAKRDLAGGRFVWALQAGGPEFDLPSALAVSGTAIYIGGGFTGPATFGTTTLPGNGARYGSFLTKVTDAGATGTFAWAQQLGSVTGETLQSVAVQGTAVYLTGYFEGTTFFGTTTLQSAGNEDVFVAKGMDTGNGVAFAWARQAGGPSSDISGPLAVSGLNVYVAGTFAQTAAFGPTQLTSAGSSDVFVAKLADAGITANFTWARRAGGPDYEFLNAMAVSGANVYLTGEFGSAAAVFGTQTLTNSRASSSDIFVAKLADAGATAAFAWAQRAGGSDYDGTAGIAVSGTNVYVAGQFLSVTAGFGATTLANTNPSRTNSDVFVAKLTDAGASGAFAWAQQAGGNGDDGAGPLLLAGTGVYVAGYYEATAAFGPFTLASPTTSRVAFLAALTDPTLTATSAAHDSPPFTLAPNPARAAATVQLPAVPGTATATLTLRDALGRALRTATVPLPAAGLRHELDLSGLPAGLYAVQVRAGAASATRRLVVE